MAYSEDHIALAAEYALGTLDAGERVQVEAMMALDTEFTAIVRSWEYRLGALNQMVGSIEPRPIVWENIKAAIGHSAVQQAPLVLPEAPQRPAAVPDAAPAVVPASKSASAGRAVKSLPPITPSERGAGSRSEISHSSKLLPGSASAPTLRTVKFLVAASTVRINAGEPPSRCSRATYCAEGVGGGAGVFTSTVWIRGLGRSALGSNSGW